MTIKKAKNGFALSIVLWIVAALMLVALLVALFSKDTVKLSNGIEQKLQARLEAHALLEKLKFYIGTANYNSFALMNETFHDLGVLFPSEIIFDGRWYTLSEQKRIRVKDASAIIDIFSLNTNVLARYLTDDVALQSTIRDSLQDWVDADEEVRLSGAERHYYQREKAEAYRPSNLYRMQHPKELELVRGVDALDTAFLQEFYKNNPFMGGSGLNLALLDPKLLAAYLQISLSYAQALVDLRNENFSDFLKEVRSLSTYDDTYMGIGVSKKFFIEIEVTHKQAKALLQTAIDFDANELFFYRVIHEQNY